MMVDHRLLLGRLVPDFLGREFVPDPHIQLGHGSLQPLGGISS
jgi:hypothetical protein